MKKKKDADVAAVRRPYNPWLVGGRGDGDRVSLTFTFRGKWLRLILTKVSLLQENSRPGGFRSGAALLLLLLYYSPS